VIEDQDYHRTNHCDEDAVEIEAGNSGRAERRENPAADQCADDP